MAVTWKRPTLEDGKPRRSFVLRNLAAAIFSVGATAGLGAVLVVCWRSQESKAAVFVWDPVRAAPKRPAPAGKMDLLGSIVAGGPSGRRVSVEKDVPEVTMDTLDFLRDLDVDDVRSIDAFLEHADAGAQPGSNESVMHVSAQLLGLATDQRPALRRGALAVLARVRPERLGVDPFTAALADRDGEVRRQAVIGVSRHHANKGWPLLSGFVLDREERVRAAVAAALGSVGSEVAERAVAEMMNDASDLVSVAAAESIGAANSAVAASEVARAARSRSARLRRAAAVAYGVSRLDADVGPEVRLARDPDEIVRRAALRGLGGFVAKDGPAVRATLETAARDPSASRAERLEAIQSLALAPGVVERRPLADVAEKDADPVLRLVAARTELAQADTSGFDVLVALLEVEHVAGFSDEDCKSVRALAGETLREATGRDPEPPNAEEWRRLLPSIGMQFVTQRLQYVPERLVGFR